MVVPAPANVGPEIGRFPGLANDANLRPLSVRPHRVESIGTRLYPADNLFARPDLAGCAHVRDVLMRTVGMGLGSAGQLDVGHGDPEALGA
jgi:hypothetical protein